MIIHWTRLWLKTLKSHEWTLNWDYCDTSSEIRLSSSVAWCFVKVSRCWRFDNISVFHFLLITAHFTTSKWTHTRHFKVWFITDHLCCCIIFSYIVKVIKSDQVAACSIEVSKMRQVVVLSMWSTVVPPKEQRPERFLCLRDTCHVEVPEEVSFHFLKLARVGNPAVCYLLGCSGATARRTFTTKRKWPYSLSYLVLSE